MRLTEIISTDYQDTNFNKANDGTKIGKGRYSNVTQKDDFSVDKQYKTRKKDVENDPYYAYVKAISDNNLADGNPYLPRINRVESGKNSDGTTRPSFNMEKLSPITSISNEVLYDMGKRIVKLPEYDQNFKFYTDREGSGAKALVSTMNRAVHTKDFSEIKDPLLINALQVIKIGREHV